MIIQCLFRLLLLFVLVLVDKGRRERKKKERKKVIIKSHLDFLVPTNNFLGMSNLTFMSCFDPCPMSKRVSCELKQLIRVLER